jgi:hypothetical protein
MCCARFVVTSLYVCIAVMIVLLVLFSLCLLEHRKLLTYI